MYGEKGIVAEFLRNYGMDYERIDMDESCESFIKEMEMGLKGSESSLQMLPTYIEMEGEIPAYEPVIAIDAGGTNFRTAVIHFDKDRHPFIEGYNTYPMPGTQGETSRKEFYAIVAKYIEPLINKSSKIGFCFSYPTETLPNKDGKLLKLSKQVQLEELIGDVIGENLLHTLKSMGHTDDKKIVMLNDAVATLLGGKSSHPDRLFDSYMGFILGTGTNTCYLERNFNIQKIKNVNDEGSMAINVESGGYNKVKRGALDIEFDRGTIDAGQYIFEKMISGRYLGGLIATVLKRASSDRIFSDGFSENLGDLNEITLPEINEFMHSPYSSNKLSLCCSNRYNVNRFDDRLITYYIIDSLIERAAKLVAINLSAIMTKIGSGKNPCRPVCITAEGSTFYKLKLFRNKLDYYVRNFMNDKLGLYCEFERVDNGTLIGTAIAGLLN